MHASIVILYIVIFFPARALRSNAVEKFGELPIGYLIAIDQKFSEINFVPRALVLRPVVAAHEKITCRDADHAVGILISRGRESRHQQKNKIECDNCSAESRTKHSERQIRKIS